MTLSSTTRYLIPATILLVAGLFITLRPTIRNPSEHHSNGPNEPMRSGTESAVQLPDLAGPARTKSKDRIHHPKPTIEETTELLRTTIIPRVDIQDQTILEVAAAINGFIQDARTPPHKLRAIVNTSVSSAGWRIKEVRIRNVPLAVLLKIVCDSTKLRYRGEPGIIRFFNAADDSLPEIPKIEESSSPGETSSDPDNPFGGSLAPQSDPSAADPFAEPAIPTSP